MGLLDYLNVSKPQLARHYAFDRPGQTGVVWPVSDLIYMNIWPWASFGLHWCDWGQNLACEVKLATALTVQTHKQLEVKGPNSALIFTPRLQFFKFWEQNLAHSLWACSKILKAIEK